MSLQVFHGVGACGWDSLSELLGPAMRLRRDGPVDHWCRLEQWEVEAIERESWRYTARGWAWYPGLRRIDAGEDVTALMRHPEGRHAAMAALVFGCCCGVHPSGGLVSWLATHRWCRPVLRIQLEAIWDRLKERNR